MSMAGVMYAQTVDAPAPKFHIFTSVSTTGRIPKWSDNTGALTDSIINETTGGQITIGFPTASLPSRLHVFSTGNADGLAIDGTSSPAVNFRNNGTVKGYLGLAMTAGAYLSGTQSGDLALRSESGNIVIGRYASSTGLVVAGSNVGIGTAS